MKRDESTTNRAQTDWLASIPTSSKNNVPLFHIILLVSMFNRANLVFSSSVNESGSVLLMPSRFTLLSWKVRRVLISKDYALI